MYNLVIIDVQTDFIDIVDNINVILKISIGIFFKLIKIKQILFLLSFQRSVINQVLFVKSLIPLAKMCLLVRSK